MRVEPSRAIPLCRVGSACLLLLWFLQPRGLVELSYWSFEACTRQLWAAPRLLASEARPAVLSEFDVK